MTKKEFVTEEDLAALAKEFRIAAGVNRTEAAHQLEVARPSLIQAEDLPNKNLTKLRIRMIEKYSPYKIAGPLYQVLKK